MKQGDYYDINSAGPLCQAAANKAVYKNVKTKTTQTELVFTIQKCIYEGKDYYHTNSAGPHYEAPAIRR